MPALSITKARRNASLAGLGLNGKEQKRTARVVHPRDFSRRRDGFRNRAVPDANEDVAGGNNDTQSTNSWTNSGTATATSSSSTSVQGSNLLPLVATDTSERTSTQTSTSSSPPAPSTSSPLLTSSSLSSSTLTSRGTIAGTAAASSGTGNGTGPSSNTSTPTPTPTTPPTHSATSSAGAKNNGDDGESDSENSSQTSTTHHSSQDNNDDQPTSSSGSLSEIGISATFTPSGVYSLPSTSVHLASHNSNTGPIIGGVVGGIVLFGLCILAAVLITRRRRRLRFPATPTLLKDDNAGAGPFQRMSSFNSFVSTPTVAHTRAGSFDDNSIQVPPKVFSGSSSLNNFAVRESFSMRV